MFMWDRSLWEKPVGWCLSKIFLFFSADLENLADDENLAKEKSLDEVIWGFFFLFRSENCIAPHANLSTAWVIMEFVER